MNEPWKTLIVWSGIATLSVGGYVALGPIGGIVGYVVGVVAAMLWKR
jgi:hypothetical protein